MKRDYKRLEDYGIIGNLETCALIGKDGSIDWLCLPHLESPGVFAAILDIDKGGHFYISPVRPYESKQSYIKETNILETRFTNPGGEVMITDFMPVRDILLPDEDHRTILRKVTCRKGTMELVISFKPRFDYGRAVPMMKPVEDGIKTTSNGEWIFLQSPVILNIRKGEARGTFVIEKGTIYWFVIGYGYGVKLHPNKCQDILERTKDFWLKWVKRRECSKDIFYSEWHDLVIRSGLVLKLLTHEDSGAIAAAPTTSLPEVIGGSRNWDYRFAWIRDASFAVQALCNIGHMEEAKRYFQWLKDTCDRYCRPSGIRIMHSMHGEQNSEEIYLVHLSGYLNLRPVRVGNAAFKQKQLDIYGELVNALYEIFQYGEDISYDKYLFLNQRRR